MALPLPSAAYHNTRHTHSLMLLAYLAPEHTKIDLLSQSYGPSGAMNSGTVRK
jgi:hypothetical protein